MWSEEPFPYLYPVDAPALCSLHVRTVADPAGVLPAIRREVRSAESNLAPV